jgi:hypothetical protein
VITMNVEDHGVQSLGDLALDLLSFE